MSKRTTLLLVALLCCLSTLAAAGGLPGAVASAADRAAALPDAFAQPVKSPESAISARLKTPAVDLGELLEPAAGRSAAKPEPGTPPPSFLAIICGQACQSCLNRCASADDPVCCRYQCHPVGLNPC